MYRSSSGSDWLKVILAFPSYDFTFRFSNALFPKLVSLTTAIAQAKFMSLPATFITRINGSARAPS